MLYFCLPLLLVFLSCMTFSVVADDDQVVLGSFSTGSLQHWESKKFKDETDYRIVKMDGQTVLKAESSASASGLYKKQKIDLRRTPFLSWRWRVDQRLEKIDEQAKSGDDYAARVYVVVSGGLAFWRTRAINYVWAESSPKGKVWPNAYAGDHAIMIALRSSDDAAGNWFEEKRNVLNDLKQQLGEDVKEIDAVAIMTDTDNAGGSAVAYYGDIIFSAR